MMDGGKGEKAAMESSIDPQELGIYICIYNPFYRIMSLIFPLIALIVVISSWMMDAILSPSLIKERIYTELGLFLFPFSSVSRKLMA